MASVERMSLCGLSASRCVVRPIRGCVPRQRSQKEMRSHCGCYCVYDARVKGMCWKSPNGAAHKFTRRAGYEAMRGVDVAICVENTSENTKGPAIWMEIA